MIGRVVIASLLIAVPASAQSPVYTNADLGKPRTWTRTATAAELASLAAHQFVAPPVFPDGPTVLVIAGDPSHGPFGPLELTAGRPLDPNWQDAGWYGPGFATGSWFGGRSLSGKGFGRIDAGLRGRGSVNPGHTTRLPPRGPAQRPPSTAPAPRSGRPQSSPGTGGGMVAHAPRR